MQNTESKFFVKFCETLCHGILLRSHNLADIRKLRWAIAVAGGQADREREFFSWWLGDWGVCWHYKMVWADCNAEGPGRMKGKAEVTAVVGDNSKSNFASHEVTPPAAECSTYIGL